MRISVPPSIFRIFPLVAFLFHCLSADSQVVFCSTTNGGGNTFSHDVLTCSDGNYVTTGKSGQNMYLTKTSNAGTLIWARHYAAGTDDEVYGAIETFDQKLVICGSFMTPSNLQDYFISKLDQNGSIIWSHSYGSSSSDDAFAVYETSDYGYIVTGQTFSLGQGHYDVFVTKLDSSGNITWSRTIGDIGEDKGYDIIETADGGYAIAGFSAPLFCSPRAAAYVLKLDATGNLLWTQAIGTTVDSHWFTGIVEGDDGKLYCAGRGTSAGGIAYFLLSQVDQVSGTVGWTRYIGSTLQQVMYEDAFLKTADSCLVIGGGYGTSSNSIITKVNYQGTVLWATQHTGQYGFHDIELSSLGGFVGCGDNFFLTQTDSSGNSCCSDTANITSFLTTFTIAPYGIPNTATWNSSASLNPVAGNGTLALTCRTCTGLSIDAGAIDHSVCVGDTTTLYVNVSSTSTGYTYLWQPGGGTSSSMVVSPIDNQSYTVTVTDSLGICSTFDTVNVSVFPNAYIDGDTLICLGDSALLSAHGGGTYVWSFGPTTPSVWVRPTLPTTYSVTVTDVNQGCSQTVTYFVDVDSCTAPTYCKLSGLSLAQFSYHIISTLDNQSVIAGSVGAPPTNNYLPYIAKYNGAGDYVWGRTVGQTDGYANSVIQLPDSGYALAGTIATVAPDYNFLLARYNKHGVLLWAHSFGGGNYDFGESVVMTPDTGLLLVGESASFGGVQEAVAVRLDLNGNILWTRKYGGPASDGASDVITTNDGGFLITGSTSSFGAGGSDMYAVRIDSAGAILWTKTIGGPLMDSAARVAASHDGGFVLAGSTRSFGAGTIDFYVAKIDSAGNLLWSYTYGTSVNQFAYDISPANDSGFIITGSSYNTSQTYSNTYIVKIDRNGMLQWTLSTPTVGFYNGTSSAMTQDGSILTTGDISLINGVAITLYKTDPNLNSCCLLPENSLQASGGSVSSGGTSTIVFTGFAVVTGSSVASISVDSCLASIPTNIEGSVVDQDISLFPNPATTAINFTSGEAILEVQIYNLSGQLIQTTSFGQNTTEAKISVAGLQSGLYMCRLVGTDKIWYKKIVVEARD